MDAKLKEALREYGGPLSEQQVQVLRDLQGWIEYCIANGLSMKSTLSVVAHDVNGILADVPFLQPKVAGYAKYRTSQDDLSELAKGADPNAD